MSENIEYIKTSRSNYSVKGHKENTSFLMNSFLKNSLHHAYIFSGDKGIGKATFAYAFSRKLLANDKTENFDVFNNNKVNKLIEANSHPDLLVIEPDENEKNPFISVEQIRKCSQFFSQTASMNKWRICILDSIDFMDISSTNTILKILEEPPSNCLFLIISHNIGMVLDTIKSRCLELRFQNLSDEIMIDKIKLLKPNILKNELDNLIINANGSFGRLENLLHSDTLKISSVINDIFEKGEFSESIYDFSDFILQDSIGINKYDVFTEILNFKLSSYIKEKAIYNPNFATNNNKIFSVRDSILDLISQQRVYKLNKKQTILSIISNLNKIIKLQKH
tara:strand:+ start:568 stop:1578 length:1011 start_codon:yes stop_codon:yes gene_type:complete